MAGMTFDDIVADKAQKKPAQDDDALAFLGAGRVDHAGLGLVCFCFSASVSTFSCRLIP